MTYTEKRAKVLAMAASFGVPAGLYASIVDELTREGILELRQTISQVGSRGLRYFLVGGR